MTGDHGEKENGKTKVKDNHFQIQCYILFMYKAFEIYTYFFYNSKPYSSESFRWPTFFMNTEHCYACLHSFQIHAASNFDWVTSEAFIVCSANRNFVAPQETQDPPLLPLQSTSVVLFLVQSIELTQFSDFLDISGTTFGDHTRRSMALLEWSRLMQCSWHSQPCPNVLLSRLIVHS